MTDTIKAYKAFNRDMTCRGHKFEEGETLESYSNLKELRFDIKWQQGKRSGGFRATTYLKQEPSE